MSCTCTCIIILLGNGSGIAQQLNFGVSDGGERLVELAAQVEDLTYQLSTTHEELQAAVERAEQAEVRTLVHYMYVHLNFLYQHQITDQAYDFNYHLICLIVYHQYCIEGNFQGVQFSWIGDLLTLWFNFHGYT